MDVCAVFGSVCLAACTGIANCASGELSCTSSSNEDCARCADGYYRTGDPTGRTCTGSFAAPSLAPQFTRNNDGSQRHNSRSCLSVSLPASLDSTPCTLLILIGFLALLAGCAACSEADISNCGTGGMCPGYHYDGTCTGRSPTIAQRWLLELAPLEGRRAVCLLCLSPFSHNTIYTRQRWQPTPRFSLVSLPASYIPLPAKHPRDTSSLSPVPLLSPSLCPS